MSDLLDEVRDVLAVDETDERITGGRAIARARLDDAMRRPTVRASSRRRRRPWIVPAVAVLVVLGGGAAIAQTTGLADRLLGTVDDRANGRIQALDDPAAPGLTDAELEDVFDQGRMREAVGDRLEGDDGVIGATIVDDRGGMRISLVRTERQGVCAVLWSGGPGAWTTDSTACIGFPPGWPVNEGVSRGPGRHVWHGVLADGVATVRFHLPDDSVIEPVVANGTYLYWPREPAAAPTAIDAVLEDGTVIRRDLTVETSAFAEFVARRRMASKCAEGEFATVAAHRRQIEACNKRHMLDAPRFEAAKPFVVTEP